MTAMRQEYAASVRRFVVIALLAMAGPMAAAGCNDTFPASGDPSSTPGASASSGATPEVSDTPAPSASAATFQPITLKGTGKKVAKFKIPAGGAALATASYGGSSNFAITSIASDGSQNDLLVNTIGKYHGTVLFDENTDQNSVAFQVEASGAWTIVVAPVSSARKWNGSGTVKGTGDDVVQITPASRGLVTLDLAFKGKENFAVTAYYADGSDLLANEIGNFTGQVLLPDGSFLLSISADGGTWSAKAG